MRIRKVDNAIEECKRYLDNSNGYGTEIEAYLTRYILILISASFEEEFEKMFVERCRKSNDQFVISYMETVISDKLKSVGIKKLSHFIKAFGGNYSDKFIREVSQTPMCTYYSNLIENRHKVAHETAQVNMTFPEVVESYGKCHMIIETVYDIINDL